MANFPLSPGSFPLAYKYRVISLILKRSSLDPFPNLQLSPHFSYSKSRTPGNVDSTCHLHPSFCNQPPLPHPSCHTQPHSSQVPQQSAPSVHRASSFSPTHHPLLSGLMGHHTLLGRPIFLAASLHAVLFPSSVLRPLLSPHPRSWN